MLPPAASSAAPASSFKPFVAPEAKIPELSFFPLLAGALLGIAFGGSSVYLVLKVGMTVSASIPVAVLSITIFRAFAPLFGRNATILENNIVQTAGSAGESIAFGVGVTMPALLILGYELELSRVILVSVLGGLLGILMMIPLRRAFIVNQHGKLIYPEGTACAQVLIVGEKGGATAATVFGGFGLAFLYKLLMSGLRLWKDIPERAIGFFKGAAVAVEISPELLGVGYIIGTRIACVMVGGGVLASWVLIPAIRMFGDGLNAPLYPGEKLIRDMSLDEIWHSYVLYIGAGAVAAGGIISMAQTLPVIFHSIRAGLSDLRRERAARAAEAAGLSATPRTERDLSMRWVIGGSIALAAAIATAPALQVGVTGGILVVLFGFFFVTVSSRLTGEVGSSSNPISGMTVATLLLTCLVFVLIGWTGEGYRLTALSIAAVVCIAASNGGTTSQDLKTGYLLGATPSAQQIAIVIGSLTSAMVIGVVLLGLNDAATIYTQKDLPAAQVDVSKLTAKAHVRGSAAQHDSKEYYVFFAQPGQHEGIPSGKYLVDDTGRIRWRIDPGINGTLDRRDDGAKVQKYSAPKAQLMSFIIDGILTQKLPWSLVLLGVSIAIVLELSGVPSLPFAVGVYLPLSSSTPIFIGGILRWIADRSAGRSESEGDSSPGVLFSSGYIAGGSLCGVLLAFLMLRWEDTSAQLGLLGEQWLGGFSTSDGAALLPFGLLVLALLILGAGRIGRARSQRV